MKIINSYWLFKGGTHPFMDGHLMFPIYGTLIIVIIYQISLISYMKKTNMVSEQDWARLSSWRAQKNKR